MESEISIELVCQEEEESGIERNQNSKAEECKDSELLK
jgi:hypothetical protein